MNIKKIFFVLFSCLFFQISIFSQESFTAKVVGVVDGDTITVYTADKRQMMIRFSGIDAPEKDQEFGAAAREQLSGLIFEQNVTITNLKKDCLERLSASVSFKNKNLNLILVEAGNAWADNFCQSNETFSKAEASAREKKIGLWQFPAPVVPSDFVKAKQNDKKPGIVQTKERKVFAGLAPNSPSGVKKLAIGMTLESFLSICGNKGELSKIYTSSSGQTFSVDNPVTEESVKKNCDGSFTFQKMGRERFFTLSSVYQ